MSFVKEHWNADLFYRQVFGRGNWRQDPTLEKRFGSWLLEQGVVIKKRGRSAYCFLNQNKPQKRQAFWLIMPKGLYCCRQKRWNINTGQEKRRVLFPIPLKLVCIKGIVYLSFIKIFLLLVVFPGSRKDRGFVRLMPNPQNCV